LQAGAPEAQSSLPWLHPSVLVQLAPAVQLTQRPAEQTRDAPQAVPSASAERPEQRGALPLQSTVPCWQASAERHEAPAGQVWHAPASQVSLPLQG
jgi:hypothetical protein